MALVPSSNCVRFSLHFDLPLHLWVLTIQPIPLLQTGNVNEAFTLAVHVMEQDKEEGRQIALSLVNECDPAAIREMPLDTAKALVILLVSELQAGRHLTAVLRWIEEVLRVRLHGRNLLWREGVSQLSRTLHSLSASDETMGVAAAKALALLSNWKDHPFANVTEPWVSLD